MKIGIIGRSEWTYDTLTLLIQSGHEVSFIVTAKEAPEYKKTARDFEELASRYNIPYFASSKIKRENLARFYDTDICVSVNYSGIIPGDIISLFRIGILNAHGGDLPKYRGNACQAWALLNAEKRIGLCIHKMIGGELDSGDIIEREYFDCTIDTRIGEVHEWMTKQIPAMMLKSVAQLSRNPNYIIEKQSANPLDALRCYPRKPEDGKIDWKLSNVDILRLINASSEPYAGAYTFLNGVKLIIWRARIVDDNEIFCGVPGQLAKIIKDEQQVIVLCGAGKLMLELISWESEITFLDLFSSMRLRLN